MYVPLDALQVYAEFSTTNIKGGNGDFYLITGLTSASAAVGIDLKATAYDADDLSLEKVNTKNNFFGVGTGQDIANNNKGDNDTLVLEFAKTDSWNTATGSQTGTYEKATLTSISFTTSAFGSGETLQWTAYLNDGTIESGTINGTGSANSSSNQKDYKLGPDEIGGTFYKIEFAAAEGTSYDLGNVNVKAFDGTVDQTTQVTLFGMDGDGDSTASQTISLTFASDNTLEGSGGPDVLAGGSGDDFLSGGDGADIFQFGSEGGHDTITDFNPAIDSLKLTDVLDNYLDGTIDGLDVPVTVDGADVTLEITGSAGTAHVTLEGINVGENVLADGSGYTVNDLVNTFDLKVDFNDSGTV
jgi:hypothetical protein